MSTPTLPRARILLTGGRAGATLDLARFFHRTGHEVHVAETWSTHITGASNSVKRSYLVRAPKITSQGYFDDLLAIITRERITHLVPTCEEIFTIAHYRAALQDHCKVWTDTADRLKALHDKAEFNHLARTMGLPAPDTRTVTSVEDLLMTDWDSGSEKVLKPAFSRFASRVLFSRSRGFIETLRFIRPAPDQPWLIQERIHGEEICTYSIAENGELLAHVNYSHEFTAGKGAGICFEAVERPAVLEWVRRFVKEYRFTGQIAFDFIIDRKTGEAHALECNPRATSGIHLFADIPTFPATFLGEPFTEKTTETTVTPPVGTLGTVTRLAMVLYGLSQVRSFRLAGAWMRIILCARDALLRPGDPLPFFEQFRTLFLLWKKSRVSGRTLLEETTGDIEWNGEKIAAQPRPGSA